MATAIRIDYAGSVHHVMNLGASGRDIFLDDHDRRVLLALLWVTMKRYDIEIVSYCLMKNHFHLVLRCRTANLSKAMQRLGSMYVRRFNRRHGFDGPLFRSRFTSVVITSDAQLQTTIRYVHRNPLGVGADIRRHPWSSYAAYLGDVPPQWGLEPGWALSTWSDIESMQQFTETDWSSDQTTIRRGLRIVKTTERSYEQRLFGRIIEAVAVVSGDPPELILTTPAPAARDSHLVAILLLDGLVPANTIAEYFGLRSEGSVARAKLRAHRRFSTTTDFAALVVQARRTAGLDEIERLAG